MIVVVTTLFLVYWKLQPMGGQNHMSVMEYVIHELCEYHRCVLYMLCCSVCVCVCVRACMRAHAYVCM